MAEVEFELTPLFVDHTTDTGLKILYDSPSELGADRIVDAAAAVAKYGAPCIVVDFGTATTFNAVNAAHEYLGGVIAPGIMISAEALFSRAAKLPRVEIKRPDKVIATSTIGAMQSGLYHGYAGLVDGVLEKMIAEMGSQPRVIATGGLAPLIAGASKFIEQIDDTLTLDGLRLIYERKRSAAYTDLNYFNYFTEIEDAFVRRRGKHLFLSPMDWALMETWKQQGIPLHIVLRGVEKSFDSFEARPRKRTVKSLLYCQEEVEAQYAEWVEARVGSCSQTTTEPDSDKTPFSFAAISEHLQRSRTRFADWHIRERKKTIFPKHSREPPTLLVDIENDFATAPRSTRASSKTR